MKRLLHASAMLLITSQSALAEMVVFENTNPAFSSLAIYDPNSGQPIFGQSLDITHSSFDQPALGQTPGASIFFMQTHGFYGDFIWLGMGRLTMTAESTEKTLIPDPYAGQLVPYYGPQDFLIGDQIDETTNFVDGWRPMHGINKLTGDEGIFTVAQAFAVGVTFEQADGVHYGFAQFERTVEFHDNLLDIQWHPIRWGYESDPGVGATVTPAPGMISLGLVGLLGCSIRNRRR